MKTLFLAFCLVLTAVSVAAAAPRVVTCIDTMKESRDSLNSPLTDRQIAQDVQLSASLDVTHITVDTPYDDPDYMARWVKAIRKAGKHVWFRCTFNAWEGIYDTPATMTPATYIAALKAFIQAHPTFFEPGDILDSLPEPENGAYWTRTSPYGNSWTWKNAPNATTDEFNKFFIDVVKAADQALNDAGVHGVNTHIRSTNGYIAVRPATLYPSTVAFMGCITTDTYVGQDPKVSPSDALKAFQDEIEGIEKERKVPLVIGEFGYSTKGLVDDTQQEAVLAPEFAWLKTLPYLNGVNYWHGAGYPAPDRYNGCKLFTGTTGAWRLRPAAKDLVDLYRSLDMSGQRK